MISPSDMQDWFDEFDTRDAQLAQAQLEERQQREQERLAYIERCWKLVQERNKELGEHP